MSFMTNYMYSQACKLHNLAYMWDLSLELVNVRTMSKCSIHLKTAVATWTPLGVWPEAEKEKRRNATERTIFETMPKFGQKVAKDK